MRDMAAALTDARRPKNDAATPTCGDGANSIECLRVGTRNQLS
jgi:hypothetical protein